MNGDYIDGFVNNTIYFKVKGTMYNNTVTGTHLIEKYIDSWHKLTIDDSNDLTVTLKINDTNVGPPNGLLILTRNKAKIGIGMCICVFSFAHYAALLPNVRKCTRVYTCVHVC